MIETDRAAFAQALTRLMKRFRQPVDLQTLEDWFDALKEHPIEKVLEGIKHRIAVGRFPPNPADVLGRIVGTDDRGNVKERREQQKDPQCIFEYDGRRCPAPAGCYELNGTRARCSQHEFHRGDLAKSVEILEHLLAHGVPFTPGTPHRQRALFLWETQGEAAVLAEFDSRYVTWLRAEQARGFTAERSVTLPPRSSSVAAATSSALTGKTLEA